MIADHEATVDDLELKLQLRSGKVRKADQLQNDWAISCVLPVSHNRRLR